MKIKGILLASAAAGIAVTPGAQAADLPYKSPVAAPIAPPSWAGFYIGLHAGGASQKGDIGFQTQLNDYNTVSFIGGGQIGYNWQAGSFVFGLEADGSWLSKGKYFENNFNQSYGTHLAWLSTVRGRFGAALGNWHLYATGGAAFARVKVSDCCFGNMATASKTRVGWALGGGAEYMLTRNWIIGAEVLFVDFGKTNHKIGGKSFTTTTNSAVIGRAKLNYKF